MSKRKIIKIDEEKCNGCGQCLPNCPEGALQVIDKKARLVSDLFCDGLGACIGYCPLGAISTEEREAENYDERKVMENIVKQGENTIKAHLKHLKDHNETQYLKEAESFLKEKGIKINLDENKGKLPCGCPGTLEASFKKKEGQPKTLGSVSELSQWPVQLKLVSPNASFFNGADLLIAADCVPFAYADFHQDLLKGKVLLVGCPKLDDVQAYEEKIKTILVQNDIKSVTYAHMEVPCCLGLRGPIQLAIKNSGKDIVFKDVTISIKGEKLNV